MKQAEDAMVVMLVACAWLDGPRAALSDAGDALDRGDRERFEAVVDVDAVVPEVAATCARLAVAQSLGDRQFQPKPAIADLANELGDAAITSATEDPDNRAKLVADFRARFPHLPVDACPALLVRRGDARIERVDATHAVGILPVDHELGGEWRVALEEQGDHWRVVGVDGAPLVAAWEKAELAWARDRATDLAKGLADGGAPDEWLALQSYVDRHPEARDVGAALAAMLAKFEAVEPPLRATETGFYKPSGLFPLRHVGTRVATDRAVDRVLVRFTFVNAAGEPVTSTGGTHALVVAGGPIAAGEAAQIGARAGGWAWPDAVGARATVVEIDWADGASWRHPGVEAGAWSTLLSD